MIFENKNIWITGASSGIGKELALTFANANANVIISGRNKQALADVKAHNPSKITPLSFDMCEETSIEHAKKKFNRITDHLDLVILNAGDCIYLSPKQLLDGELSATDVQKQMDINFNGTINCLSMALPLLTRCPNRAKIYAVSSLVTEVPLSQAESYGASKAAIEYFFRTLRVDLARDMDVGIIRPGFVKTPLTDKNKFKMPFLLEANDAAQLIVRKISQNKLEIGFPWLFKTILNALSRLPASTWVSLAQRTVRL